MQNITYTTLSVVVFDEPVLEIVLFVEKVPFIKYVGIRG